MTDPLAPLLADGVIEEVVARLKSGKEADLWLVRHGGEVVAAKVYKAREARSFRNNAAYKEGRTVRDTRTQRAMARGSRFGQAAAEEAWKAKEAEALHTLHAAGVRVPRPVMFYEGVLLMEVVVDAGGHPAPRLIDAQVPREAAAPLYADLRSQVVRMLCCDLVHGDLSPYNVLLGAGGPVLIDFPQVVGAAHNSQAEGFFQRDLKNLQRFLAAIDPALHASAADGSDIWRAYARRELSPGYVPSARGAQRSGHEHRRPAAAPQAPPRHRPPSHAPPSHAPPSHAPPRTPPASGRGPRDGRAGRRRTEARAPEVIRVVRPGAPVAAQGAGASRSPAHGAGAPHSPPHAAGSPHSPAAGQQPGQPHRRRRRRRSPHGHGPPR